MFVFYLGSREGIPITLLCACFHSVRGRPYLGRYFRLIRSCVSGLLWAERLAESLRSCGRKKAFNLTALWSWAASQEDATLCIAWPWVQRCVAGKKQTKKKKSTTEGTLWDILEWNMNMKCGNGNLLFGIIYLVCLSEQKLSHYSLIVTSLHQPSDVSRLLASSMT